VDNIKSFANHIIINDITAPKNAPREKVNNSA